MGEINMNSTQNADFNVVKPSPTFLLEIESYQMFQIITADIGK